MRTMRSVIRKRRQKKGGKQTKTTHDICKVAHGNSLAPLAYNGGVHIEVTKEFSSKIGQSATASPLCDPRATQSDLTFPYWKAAEDRKKEEQIMRFNRRLFVAGALAAPFLTGRAVFATEDSQGPVRNNISAFRAHDWQDHFDSLGVGIIISDTTSKVLQHWTSDGQMFLYPTSVPLSDELTRRGYTEVVEKRVNPSWAPTPSMRKRNPEWPAFVPGGDPTNPLGTRALYLSWQYYRIHGTHDTRKIGRRASNGCIGLYNEHIEEVFDRTPIGTQVKLI